MKWEKTWQEKKKKISPSQRKKMGTWEAMDWHETVVLCAARNFARQEPVIKRQIWIILPISGSTSQVPIRSIIPGSFHRKTIYESICIHPCIHPWVLKLIKIMERDEWSTHLHSAFSVTAREVFSVTAERDTGDGGIVHHHIVLPKKKKKFGNLIILVLMYPYVAGRSGIWD